ncbi:MAG: isoprenyl transferase [Bacteroidales bacterium]
MLKNSSSKSIPKHVAIIMDGNGRWAKARGLGRVFGHRNGVAAVRAATEAAAKIGVDILTLYTFSTENWGRPQSEIDALMGLLIDAIEKEEKTLQRNQVKFSTIGDLNTLPIDVQERIEKITLSTSQNKGLTLVIAINYSGRWDLVNATKMICQEFTQGKLNVEMINDELIEKYLSTSQMPNPDLFIRTGGDFRLSNFLLWQIAYSELLFTDVQWPDFREKHFMTAVEEFNLRERRFGRLLEE